MKRHYAKPAIELRTTFLAVGEAIHHQPPKMPKVWVKPEISRTPTPNTVTTILIPTPKPEEPK